MGKRITVDPISRIEGHLRIEVEIEGGKVTNAWSSGQMFRGIEMILQGRDPRDAHHFVQRSCGVCTYVHALSSIRAVEDAVGVKIPDNARIIRNRDPRCPVPARSYRSLLSPPRTGLGGCGECTFRGSGRNGKACRHSQQCTLGRRGLLQEYPAAPEILCGERPAGTFS